MGAGTPLATTVNVADEPDVTVWADGCVVMAGGTLTVTYAPDESLPATLETIT